MYIKIHTVCVFVYSIEKLSGTSELGKLKLHKLLLESETVYILK